MWVFPYYGLISAVAFEIRDSNKKTCEKMGMGLQVKLEYEQSQGTILGVWEHDRSG